MSYEYCLNSRKRYIIYFEGGGKPFEADSAVDEKSAFSVPMNEEFPLLELKRGYILAILSPIKKIFF